jgi:hypothetical protein
MRLADLEAKFWASPYGQARNAKTAGDRYFQVELPMIAVVRTNAGITDIAVTQTQQTGQGRTPSEIEREGWELIHAGSVFKETGQTSRDKFMSSGQQVNTMGETWGAYLFRATDAAPRTDEVWVRWYESGAS